jgi:hypothetical protein
MNAIQIIALIALWVTALVRLLGWAYLVVWLAVRGLPMYLHGEKPPLKWPTVVFTAVLAAEIIRRLGGMALVSQGIPQ